MQMLIHFFCFFSFLEGNGKSAFPWRGGCPINVFAWIHSQRDKHMEIFRRSFSIERLISLVFPMKRKTYWFSIWDSVCFLANDSEFPMNFVVFSKNVWLIKKNKCLKNSNNNKIIELFRPPLCLIYFFAEFFNYFKFFDYFQFPVGTCI